MRWKGLLGLLLVLAALVALWFAREKGKAATAKTILAAQYVVFEDYASERIVSIRIDHLRRGVQVKFERDTQGSWFLTDPLAYPANVGVINALLRTFINARGEPAGRVDLADVKLDPPLAVLEFTQRNEGGDRIYRIEIGDVDLSDSRIYTRVLDHSQSIEEDGSVVLLCTRAIANTIERNPNDYRNTRATHLSGSDVVGFHRSGSVYLPERGEIVDLSLRAELGVDGWKKLDPPTVRLEPNAIGLLARGAAETRVRRFTSDAPRSYSEWGLDPPVFSIELHSRRGDPVRLDFGFPSMQGPGLAWAEQWFCRRVGSSYVWEVEANDVALLVRPSEDLFDYFLVHAQREDMRRVDFEASGRTLTLERIGERWTVSITIEGETSGPFPASVPAVQDVLAKIEKTELRYPLPSEELGAPEFVALEPPMAITITTDDGERWGGRIGAEWRDPSAGLVARTFVRFGDELTGVIEEVVSGLCLLDVDHFRSLQVHRIQATGVRGVKLRHDGVEFSYLHPDDERWIIEGTRFDAPDDFKDCVQTLVSIRADEWLSGSDQVEPDALADAIDFEVHLRNGDVMSFRLGLTDEDTLVCLEAGLAAVVSSEQLEQHRVAWGSDFFPTLRGLFGGGKGE